MLKEIESGTHSHTSISKQNMYRLPLTQTRFTSQRHVRNYTIFTIITAHLPLTSVNGFIYSSNNNLSILILSRLKVE